MMRPYVLGTRHWPTHSNCSRHDARPGWPRQRLWRKRLNTFGVKRLARTPGFRPWGHHRRHRHHHRHLIGDIAIAIAKPWLRKRKPRASWNQSEQSQGLHGTSLVPHHRQSHSESHSGSSIRTIARATAKPRSHKLLPSQKQPESHRQKLKH